LRQCSTEPQSVLLNDVHYAQRDRAYGHLLFGVPAEVAKIPSEDDLEGSIPFLILASSTDPAVLLKNYKEPRPRNSQVNLDKNAEPPWDPDPIP
jgi:hypothetical protein